MTIKETGVKEWLFKQGATPAQIDSKAVDMIVKGMTNEEISTSETARQEIGHMKTEIAKADHKADQLFRGIQKVEERYSRVAELLEQVEVSAAERAIQNQTIVDGVNAFAQMLRAVHDEFGHNNMTEAVICEAINAASYGYWRSVMGGKHPDEQEQQGKRRVGL